MKKIIITISLVFMGFFAQAQYTAIPDANFEQALFDLGIDTVNGDHQVLTSNVSGLTSLYVSSKNISDLTGIQAFISLTELYCSNNLLTSLNVSGLTNLSVLYCNENKLTSMNLSGCSSLQSLNCRFNYLPSLNFSNTPNLTQLVCGSNKFTSLNVTSLTNLTYLNCNNYNVNEDGYLVGFDLFNSDSYLYDNYIAQNNTLTTLNVSGLTNLQTLWCSNGTISSLNLSGLTSLFDLRCQNNISTLDLSGSTNLYNADLRGNPLTTLNISNLNNLTKLELAFTNLTSLNASGLIHLTTLTVQDCPLTSLNVTNCSALVDLNCSHAKLSTLSLTGCSALQTLQCEDNELTSLNLSGLTALKTLMCGNYYNVPGSRNQITSINFTGATGLTNISCYNNLLTNLNLSSLTNLDSLDCHNNQLSSLNVSGLTSLTNLDCSNNPALSCIQVTNVAAANANGNWTKDTTASYSTNCGGIPTSKIKADQCGTTLATLNANINADYVAGYQQYRFEVTKGATVNTIDVNKYNFSLTQTPGITYGTTYGVRVAVKMGGTWGNYGPSCNITTPALTVNTVPTTTIMPAFCGTTLATLDTKIGATPVSGASGYRFEIVTGGVTTVYDSAAYNFKLSQAGVAAYGTTYSIRVAALVNGTYGNYGSSCNVSTPVLAVNTVPTTTIMPAFCGATLAALDTKIGAVIVAGATKGRFEVTIAGGSPVVYEVAAYNFKLSQTGVVVAYNTTYSIRVAAFVNGVWGNYGPACTVTTPAAPAPARMKAKTFEVTAYPNPFDTAFNLSLETPSTEVVTIAVYDMMGKLVENHQVNPMEVANLQIGSNFATGIYNVVVSQANEMQAIRMVRK